MPIILHGKVVRDAMEKSITEKIVLLKRAPTLAIIEIGNNEESNAYIKQKKLFAEKIGAKVLHTKLPGEVSESAVVATIKDLNKDESIDGIILQLPIPSSLNKELIIDTIYPHKDVDGLTSVNLGKLVQGDSSGFVSATAKGVLSLLDYYKIPLSGKGVVVIGRSVLVGKPIALLLLSRNTTVTICHSKTENLDEITQSADILIVAVGKEKFITDKYIKEGQTVIDVGINVKTKGGKLEEEIPKRILVGDVDFDVVKEIVGAISPVPGGVGPMTVVSLFENLLKAATNKM